MLVLTRKLDEAIRIGDDIKITILRVKGNTIRIGIEAPREVRVVRDELDTTAGGNAVAAKPQAETLRAETLRAGTLTRQPAAEPVAPSVPAAERVPAAEPTAAAAPATAPTFELLRSERPLGREEGAVVTTVVDSPQPSSTQLYVGKVRVHTAGRNRLSDHRGGGQADSDQAAPLRAFLRSSHKLQVAG